eukprot:CAMPEP_0206472342 /NCGR_PEP_ID=MMETSP0324_2-20121206/32136_1 /ASSEMBLY_ACC=CAM_ASM_000836 /TAXON_ID=2866 /ORGANISM="Crypthecodinium cohnii, Strain Seligo" /LENGTH=82 /DNA_ID=CAMNT_0053946909 /DNA_START=529 /DNA_END=777 /DNA_ORIENTATION=-
MRASLLAACLRASTLCGLALSISRVADLSASTVFPWAFVSLSPPKGKPARALRGALGGRTSSNAHCAKLVTSKGATLRARKA